MPCSLRHRRAARAQLLRSNYGSVRLRLRMEAHHCHRRTPLRGSGRDRLIRGHLRRNPRNPNLHRRLLTELRIKRNVSAFLCALRGFNRSSDMRGGFIILFLRLIRMMAAVDGLSSCGSVWINGALRGRGPAAGHVWRTEDTSRALSRVENTATSRLYFPCGS